MVPVAVFLVAPLMLLMIQAAAAERSSGAVAACRLRRDGVRLADLDGSVGALPKRLALLRAEGTLADAVRAATLDPDRRGPWFKADLVVTAFAEVYRDEVIAEERLIDVAPPLPATP